MNPPGLWQPVCGHSPRRLIGRDTTAPLPEQPKCVSRSSGLLLQKAEVAGADEGGNSTREGPPTAIEPKPARTIENTATNLILSGFLHPHRRKVLKAGVSGRPPIKGSGAVPSKLALTVR